MKIRNEVKISLFSIAILFIIYFGIYYLRGKSLFPTKKKEYHVLYDHIEGLQISNPVLLNGVKIGIVRNIKILPEKKFKIQVVFAVDKQIILTDQSIATIINYDFLGSKAIDINVHSKGKKLNPGDFLKGSVEKNLQESLKENFFPLIDELTKTANILHTFIATITKSQLKIDRTIHNIESITYQIKKIALNSQKEIDQIIKQIALIIQCVSDEKMGIAPLLSELNLLINTFNHEKWGDIIQKMHGMAGHLEKSLSPDNQTNTLSMLMHNKTLYEETTLTIQSLRQLLVDIKNNPNKYIHFSVFGKKNEKEERREK